MKTMSFEEIENVVVEYMIHMDGRQTVELYEHITGEQVEVEDWI
jgi:hypothetical protein